MSAATLTEPPASVVQDARRLMQYKPFRAVFFIVAFADGTFGCFAENTRAKMNGFVRRGLTVWQLNKEAQ